ncbi:hypothetical protein I3843_10G142200 [Carya illinoinensis]|nr:hypothetical protein I3843_10G142200 [Carya illinoinensis]
MFSKFKAELKYFLTLPQILHISCAYHSVNIIPQRMKIRSFGPTFIRVEGVWERNEAWNAHLKEEEKYIKHSNVGSNKDPGIHYKLVIQLSSFCKLSLLL